MKLLPLFAPRAGDDDERQNSYKRRRQRQAWLQNCCSHRAHAAPTYFAQASRRRRQQRRLQLASQRLAIYGRRQCSRKRHSAVLIELIQLIGWKPPFALNKAKRRASEAPAARLQRRWQQPCQFVCMLVLFDEANCAIAAANAVVVVVFR